MPEPIHQLSEAVARPRLCDHTLGRNHIRLDLTYRACAAGHIRDTGSVNDTVGLLGFTVDR